MANGIIIDVGFKADINKFVQSLETQFKSIDYGKYIGLSDAFEKQEKELKGKIAELKRLLATDWGNGQFDEVNKQINDLKSSISDISKAMTALIKAAPSDMQANLGKQLSSLSGDAEELTSTLKNAGKVIKELNSASGKASGNATQQRIKEYKELKEVIEAVEDAEVRSANKSGDKKFAKSDEFELLDRLEEAYEEFIRTQDEFDNANKNDPDYAKKAVAFGQAADELNRLANAYRNLGLNMNSSAIEFEDETFSVNDIKDDVEAGFSKIIDVVKNRIGIVKSEIDEMGVDIQKAFQKSVASSDTLKLTVPLDISTTAPKLRDRALELIKTVQSSLSSQPLEVEVQLISDYGKYQNTTAMKKLAAKLPEIDDAEVKKQVEDLIEKINSRLDSALEFQVKIASDKATQQVKDFVAQMQDELDQISDSLHIRPIVEISDEAKGNLQKQIQDLIGEGVAVNITSVSGNESTKNQTSYIETLRKKLGEIKMLNEQVGNSYSAQADKAYEAASRTSDSLKLISDSLYAIDAGLNGVIALYKEFAGLNKGKQQKGTQEGMSQAVQVLLVQTQQALGLIDSAIKNSVQADVAALQPLASKFGEIRDLVKEVSSLMENMPKDALSANRSGEQAITDIDAVQDAISEAINNITISPETKQRIINSFEDIRGSIVSVFNEETMQGISKGFSIDTASITSLQSATTKIKNSTEKIVANLRSMGSASDEVGKIVDSFDSLDAYANSIAQNLDSVSSKLQGIASNDNLQNAFSLGQSNVQSSYKDMQNDMSSAFSKSAPEINAALDSEISKVNNLRESVQKVTEEVNNKVLVFKNGALEISSALKSEVDSISSSPLDNLKDAFNNMQMYARNNDLSSEAGQKAALAYYEAYKEALYSKVNKGDLQKLTLGNINDLFSGDYRKWKNGTGALNLDGLNQQIKNTKDALDALNSSHADQEIRNISDALSELIMSQSGSEELTKFLTQINRVVSSLGSDKGADRIEKVSDNLQDLGKALEKLSGTKTSPILEQVSQIIADSESLKVLGASLQSLEKSKSSSSKSSFSLGGMEKDIKTVESSLKKAFSGDNIAVEDVINSLDLLAKKWTVTKAATSQGLIDPSLEKSAVNYTNALADNIENLRKNLLEKADTRNVSGETVQAIENMKGQFEELQAIVIKVRETGIFSEEDKAKVKALVEDVRNLNDEIEGSRMAKTSSVEKVLQKIARALNENSAMSSDLKNRLKAVSDELESMGSNVPIDRFNQLNEQALTLFKEIQQAGRVGRNFFDKFKDTFSHQAAALFARYLSFYDVVRYARQAYTTITTLDTALVDLRKTTTMTNSELQEFYFSANDIAKEMGVTTEEIINQASAWSRLGLEIISQTPYMVTYG